MIAPVRSAHVCNCSAAAARNVSPGTIITFAPAFLYQFDNFPIVVVFPPPLTPMIRTHVGIFSSSETFIFVGSPPSFKRMFTMVSFNARLQSSPVLIFPSSTSSRMVSKTFPAVFGPKSTDNNVSSNSSKVSSKSSNRHKPKTSSMYDNFSLVFEVPEITRSKSDCVFFFKTDVNLDKEKPALIITLSRPRDDDDDDDEWVRPLLLFTL